MDTQLSSGTDNTWALQATSPSRGITKLCACGYNIQYHTINNLSFQTIKLKSLIEETYFSWLPGLYIVSLELFQEGPETSCQG